MNAPEEKVDALAQWEATEFVSDPAAIINAGEALAVEVKSLRFLKQRITEDLAAEIRHRDAELARLRTALGRITTGLADALRESALRLRCEFVGLQCLSPVGRPEGMWCQSCLLRRSAFAALLEYGSQKELLK